MVGMKISERLRDTGGPEIRGLDKHGCRALVIPLSLNSPSPSKLSPFVYAWNNNLPLSAPRTARVAKPPRSARIATCDGSSQAAVMKNAHKTRAQPNDIVIFANQLGTWKVVASVNGSKADIRRNGGFDTRIITARLESLTLIRGAGSPEYGY